ncbi:MAG TPA: hypothetical protein VKU00_11545 [Chthonomonadaceae bacterium]|nr:hypothetical protein [Chthonomonadaceae bacterium]
MVREAIDRDNISMKIPRQVNRLWEATAKRMGLDKTATFTIALRQLAQREGVPLEDEEMERTA